MVEGLPLVKRLKKELEQLEEENEELQSLLMDARAHTRRQSDIIDSLIHNPER
jgi:transposase-like protein